MACEKFSFTCKSLFTGNYSGMGLNHKCPQLILKNFCLLDLALRTCEAFRWTHRKLPLMILLKNTSHIYSRTGSSPRVLFFLGACRWTKQNKAILLDHNYINCVPKAAISQSEAVSAVSWYPVISSHWHAHFAKIWVWLIPNSNFLVIAPGAYQACLVLLGGILAKLCCAKILDHGLY